MTLSLDPDDTDRSVRADGFDVRTLQCDTTRASIRLAGWVDTDGAAVLEHVIDGHLRAGRRFIRMHLGEVRTLSAAAVRVIATAHDRLLTCRGTMILTGVSDPLDAVLQRAGAQSPLLVVSPTAAELHA